MPLTSAILHCSNRKCTFKGMLSTLGFVIWVLFLLQYQIVAKAWLEYHSNSSNFLDLFIQVNSRAGFTRTKLPFSIPNWGVRSVCFLKVLSCLFCLSWQSPQRALAPVPFPALLVLECCLCLSTLLSVVRPLDTANWGSELRCHIKLPGWTSLSSCISTAIHKCLALLGKSTE